jgi:hypothetical protein
MGPEFYDCQERSEGVPAVSISFTFRPDLGSGLLGRVSLGFACLEKVQVSG